MLFTQSPSSRVTYVNHISRLTQLPAAERRRLAGVSDRYAFRANSYYLGLINWDDPDDPIRQLVVPRLEELEGGGQLDASKEADNTVARGVQHKYPETVVLLCNETCGANCRYCFRKRLFMDSSAETGHEFSEAIEYIASHPEITNVLLTGGDALLMPTPRLANLLQSLREIPHLRVIRIGSKMPAFNPWRILDDPELVATLRQYSEPERRIYLMTHFDHPRELTDPAVKALDMIIRSGVICANQCPLIRGVNDDAETLSNMFRRLSWIGCPPYYLFQCRPTAGNRPYQVPIARGWSLFREALRHGSGLARRARYVMSHATGKIEILAVDDRHIYLRYHRAKQAGDRGTFLTCRRSEWACWLDDLETVAVSPVLPREALAWKATPLAETTRRPPFPPPVFTPAHIPAKGESWCCR